MPTIWIIGNGVCVIGTIICLAYLYHVEVPSRHRRWPMISAIIIGTTALVTGLQFVFPELLLLLRRDLAGLRSGEAWPLVTPLFVQPYGLYQCLSNAVLALLFLPLAEKLYGHGLWALYFVSGVAGTIVCYGWLPDGGGGSSTAVFGVIGGVLAYVWRHRSAGPPALVLVVAAGGIAGVVLAFARDGHGVGLLVGAVVALALRADPPPLRAKQRALAAA